MYCKNFEYAGEKLSDYGMILCTFNGSGGIETASSGADLTFHQAKPTGSNQFNLYASTYDTSYTSTFQICKNPGRSATQEDMYLSPDLVSSLQRWLCRKEYHKFKIDQEDYDHIHWNAIFASKQITLNGKIVGLELNLHTDAPFAYMDEVSVGYTCPAGTSFDFYDASDEEGFIYPDMEITILTSGDFILKNTMVGDSEEDMENKAMRVKNCTSGEIIQIDGKNQIITTFEPSHEIAKDFNYLFPKIVNSYGNHLNTFTPNLNCSIQISYCPIKKVGL